MNSTASLCNLISKNISKISQRPGKIPIILPKDPTQNKLYFEICESFDVYIALYDSLSNLQNIKEDDKKLYDSFYEDYKKKSFFELVRDFENLKRNEMQKNLSFDEELNAKILECCGYIGSSGDIYYLSYGMGKLYKKHGDIKKFVKLVNEGIELSRKQCNYNGVRKGLKLLRSCCD